MPGITLVIGGEITVGRSFSVQNAVRTDVGQLPQRQPEPLLAQCLNHLFRVGEAFRGETQVADPGRFVPVGINVDDVTRYLFLA